MHNAVLDVAGSLSIVLGVQGCVVAQLEKVDILVGVIIEKNCGASLTLEVNAVFLLVRHLKDLDLKLCALENGLDIVLTVSGIVDLLRDLEVQLPGCVRHLEYLSLLLHLLRKLGEQVIGTEVREESVGTTLIFVEFLGCEADDLGLRTITLGLVHVIVAQINLAVQVEVTASRVANLCALGGLALLFGKSALFVDLMARGEL